jgi:16S rRNA (cytosine967-C5)-methyltransferase
LASQAEAELRMAPGAPALAAAARSIKAIVVDGRSAEAAMAPYESPAHRSAMRAITLGTARWYLRLAPAVERLLARPGQLAPEVRALLVVAAHQVEYSRNAPEATVDAAVDAARLLRQPRAAGLVNAVLRRFVRERQDLLAVVDREPAAAHAHPAWLTHALQVAWPDHWQAILEAGNQHPPMTLRVNLSRISVEQYQTRLANAGLQAHVQPWLPGALVLERPVAAHDLPGLADGLVSLQDAAAQLAASLLGAEPGMRVLDACAAPGGKALHILERTPALAELVAVDSDATRMERVRENLRRAGATARLLVADVRQLPGVPDLPSFDRILLDAPCSATGVIRRHPDIKLLRQAQDITKLAAQQRTLLRAALGLLAPGGRLLYCTCSLLPQENEEVIQQVLAGAPDVRPVTLPAGESLAPGALDRVHGVQLLPGTQAGSDGFYYACVEKTTAGNQGSGP